MLLYQARRRSKKDTVEPVDPYQEFKDDYLDAAEARKKLHSVNAAVNLAADLFDHVSHDRESCLICECLALAACAELLNQLVSAMLYKAKLALYALSRQGGSTGQNYSRQS